MSVETSPELTTVKRFQRGIDLSRERGVRFKMNVMQCCRGCIEPNQLGLTGYDDHTPYAYVYGGQGQKITWVNGEPETGGRGNKHRPERIYLNWGNGSAQVLVDSFTEAGFTVEWSGNDFDTVAVMIPGVKS